MMITRGWDIGGVSLENLCARRSEFVTLCRCSLSGGHFPDDSGLPSIVPCRVRVIVRAEPRPRQRRRATISPRAVIARAGIGGWIHPGHQES
jgi:hypothetical protein